MSVAVFVLACLVGLGVLARSADEFVKGAARLATIWSIPPLVIGAVIVGFGTSAPEMLVSGLAAAGGDVDLGIGNVVGSNVANLTLVLGVAALICPMVIDSSTLRREAPLSVAAAALFLVAVWNGISTVEGVGLLVVLGFTLLAIFRGGTSDTGDDEMAAEVAEFVESDGELSVGTEAVRTLLGLLATMGGAQALVWGALGIATEVGVSEGLVGLTLVAIGTSLPELLTAVAAARQQEEELVIGNLLGSNIFNSLAVGAVIGIVGDGGLGDVDLVRFSGSVMIALVALAVVLMAMSNRVDKWQATLLLGAYAVSIPLLAA